MNLRIILLIISSFIFTNCNKHVEKVIKINFDINSKEKCYYFINNKTDTLRFERQLIVIENTLNDTIVIGHGVLAPKETGKIQYTKLDNRNDISLDLEYDNPVAKSICVSPFKEKKSFGKLKLKLIIVKE